MLFDITNLESFKKIKNIVKEVREATFYGIEIFLVGNKTDLKYLREVAEEEAANLKKELKLTEYLEISCLNGFNFDRVFKTIVKKFRAIFFSGKK